VEAQNDFYPGYPLIKRGIYYCCRMISSQYGREFTGSHYEKIKKVYSIWICMNPPKSRENTITRYRVVEEHLVGGATEPVRDYDLMSIIMLCLGSPDGENYDGVLRMLDVLLGDDTSEAEKRKILQDDYDIQMKRIMKACLAEYQDCDVNEIAEKYIEGQPQVSNLPVLPDEGGTIINGMDTEDKSVHEGTVTYDIRFRASVPGTGEQIGLIINVEAQNDFYPGYPLIKRGIYYCCRMISSQYGREFTGSHY